MAFKLAEAYVQLSSKGFTQVQGQLTGINKHLGGMRTGMTAVTAAVGAFAASGAVRTMMSFVESTAEAEKQTAKLASVLKATGGVSGQTVEGLEAVASQLQSVTAFEDDVIKGGQAILLTFKSIRGDTFRQATEAALDLSTVFEQDLKASAMMVGKALEDPIRGITALRKAGVSFTKDQQDVIKSLVETGNAAQAQAMILKEINSQVGGSAKAVGNTTFGQIEQLKNAAGDAAEEIGKVFVPALRMVTGMLRDMQRLSPYARAENAKMLGGEMTSLTKQLSAATNQRDAQRIMARINSLAIDAAGLGVSGAVESGLSFARSPAMRNRMSGLPSEPARPQQSPWRNQMVYPMNQQIMGEMQGLDAGLQGDAVGVLQKQLRVDEQTARLMEELLRIEKNKERQVAVFE